MVTPSTSKFPLAQSEVTANLDYASPAASHEPGYSSEYPPTEKLYIVNWNTLLFYPAGYTSDQITYTSSLRLPQAGNSGRLCMLPARQGARFILPRCR